MDTLKGFSGINPPIATQILFIPFLLCQVLWKPRLGTIINLIYLVQKQTSSTVAEVQLVYKFKCNISLKPKISKSSECYSLLVSNWNQDTIELCEEFKK